MGDRVSVHIMVRNKDLPKALEILSNYHGSDLEVTELGPLIKTIELAEVNYANIKDETQELISTGIPFSYTWDAGGGFDSGEGYIRFSDAGELIHEEYCEDARRIDPHALIAKLAYEFTSLAHVDEYVRNHVSKYSLEQPWDNQDANFKKYKLKQIVV